MVHWTTTWAKIPLLLLNLRFHNRSVPALQHPGVNFPWEYSNAFPPGQLQNMRVQPLSRTLVSEPMLCVEVSPTISCWYRSTSHTSSGSVPASFFFPGFPFPGEVTVFSLCLRSFSSTPHLRPICNGRPYHGLMPRQHSSQGHGDTQTPPSR